MVTVLGSTFTGRYDDIPGIAALLDALRDEVKRREERRERDDVKGGKTV